MGTVLQETEFLSFCGLHIIISLGIKDVGPNPEDLGDETIKENVELTVDL